MSSRPEHDPEPSELNTSNCSLAFLEVGKDKLTVRYNGAAQHDNDVGSIQSNHPVPRRRLVYYFEVTIKEGGVGGSITLGYSDPNFKQGRHPGYEPYSYGYRGDTGRKHHSSLPARGEEYAAPFGPGDVVGAGIHLTKHEIFFTKNGQHLGTAFRHVTGHPLYPTVGLHSTGASVEINFGRHPFVFDLPALVAREQAAQAAALESTAGGAVSAGDVHQLVRAYLLHYGYAESLAAFDEAAGMQQAAGGGVAAGMEADGAGVAQQPPDQQQQQQQQQQGSGDGSSDRDAAALALLPLRAQLRQLLMAGDTAAARQLLEQQAPELLAAAPAAAAGGSGGSSSSSFELQFYLACQQYIELIRQEDIGGALAYAESTLSALRGVSAQHDARLRDVVALIAYPRPEQSPLALLLSPAQREATADVINAALLQSHAPLGSPEPQAALEAVLQQLSAVQHELHELAGGHGPEFNLEEHLPQPAPQQQRQQQQGGGAISNGGGGGSGSAAGEAGSGHAPGSGEEQEPVDMAE